MNSKDSKQSVEAVVLVDVFRSSATIVEALDNGAEYILPCTSVVQAKIIRERFEGEGKKILLSGEKMGVTPKGFDLNISPLDMKKSVVQDKIIVYCSTNLTRILNDCKFAKTILVGGLTNARAIAEYLKNSGMANVVLVACGALCMITLEDVIGVGAIVERLSNEDLTDSAMLALMVFQNPRWKELVYKGWIAKYLQKIGFGKDVQYCIREARARKTLVI
jgi:2-phosphosulfolactate phosphatase